MVSCEEENELTITPRTDFTLNNPQIGTVIINSNYDEASEALRLTWEDFSNTSGDYTLQMSNDDEFANMTDIASVSEKNYTITFNDLNTGLVALGINGLTSNTLYLRISKDTATTNWISFKILSTTIPVAAPQLLTPTTGDSFILETDKQDDEIATVSWSYTNESSKSITFSIEAALAGTNFATIVSGGIVEDATSISWTTLQLNDLALSAGLIIEESGDLDIRIKASFIDGSNTVEVYSNTNTISVTPVDFALPPALYVVGAGAVDAGWGWTSPVELLLQGKKWSGNIKLTPNNGGNFRFFTDKTLEWASPSYNFPYFKDRGYTIDSNFEDAMDGDNNFLFVGTEGEYFIEIDTDAKTITLGPPVVGPNCNFDQLWVVGAGAVDAGWNWNSPIKISCTGTGVYQGNINLTNDAFRFFTTKDDWGSGRNHPFYANDGYTIDSDLEDALDGDNNFKFTGTPGEYGLTIDTVNKTIELGPKISLCDLDQLWLVGAGVPDAGWGWATPVSLPCTGAGVYSGQVTFANDAFRFFTEKDNWSSGLNHPHYVGEGYTIDANFEDALDGDNNFRFIGTPGTFTLTVDTVNKTITLN
ncbi:hypothetical protein BTO18_05820 [Polaribacter porphyrae]|uniref:SusE outer membrane protein domain-containing protein n=2 Tax=Polaribacter porphyrae TaxID=1137780 RepID=A0A2S7WMA6_9FLAO|nr:hypothetical protein BTO18_05820 [Polaribacter porphyrae]